MTASERIFKFMRRKGNALFLQLVQLCPLK
jgi:hypothetical protein